MLLIGVQLSIDRDSPQMSWFFWRISRKDEVKQILEIRKKNQLICGDSLSVEGCTPISNIVPNPIFPSPTYTASVFTIVASAQVGDVKRSIEAVVNRRVDPPLMLSWQVR